MNSSSRTSAIAPLVLAFITSLAFTVTLKPPAIFFYVIGGIVLITVFFLATQDQRQFKFKEIWWSVLVCILLGGLVGRFIAP